MLVTIVGKFNLKGNEDGREFCVHMYQFKSCFLGVVYYPISIPSVSRSVMAGIRSPPLGDKKQQQKEKEEEEEEKKNTVKNRKEETRKGRRCHQPLKE